MSETNLRRSGRPRRSTVKGKEYEEECKSPKKKSRSIRIVDTTDEDSSDSETEEKQATDTVLTNTPLAGKQIYTFDKIKKHERIISTPSRKEKKSLPPKTPHHLRKNLRKGINSIVLSNDLSDQDIDFIDSGSEYSHESSTDSDSTDTEDTKEDEEASEEEIPKVQTRKMKPTTTKLSNNKQPNRTNNKYIIKTDEFFSQNSQTKVTTSNHTLDKLKTPRLNQSELNQLLSNMKLGKEHEKSIKKCSKIAENYFPKWLCLMHEDYNILVYGLGSKRSILGAFHEEISNNGFAAIVINGFFPSLTLKDILDSIIVNILELTENPSNAFDACELISQEMSNVPDQHLYLIIHNIEGDMLRNNKSQSVLAKLASIKNIHLVASIDHINAPLVWDHNKLGKFKFVWYDITNYLPYIAETSFESSMMVQRTGNLALSSLRNVFLSLTSNSKGIFMIILKYQLEHGNNQYYQGLVFKDLYWSCREAFLVSSDLALRAQLTEFTDHKMIKLKRSADGAEYLSIPIANNLLQQFLDEQN